VAVLASLAWVPFIQSIPWGEPISSWTPAALSPGPVGGLHAETWHYVNQMGAMDASVGDGFSGRLIKTLVRMGANLLQAVCVCAVLHIVPRGEWPIITDYGTRSLANYVFHPLSGMLMSYCGFFGPVHSDQTPWWGELAVFISIVPTSLFWMSPWVWKIANPIFDPPIHWFLKPAAPGKDGASSPMAAKIADLAAGAAERVGRLLAGRRGDRAKGDVSPSSSASFDSSAPSDVNARD